MLPALRKRIGRGCLGVVVAILLLCFAVFWSRRNVVNYLEPDAPRFEGHRAPTLAAPRLAGHTFAVASFNIHFGYEPEKVIATLRAEGMAEVDVLLLQESDDRSALMIAEALGMNSVYYPANTHPHSNRLFGVAVLSRWPIRSARKILLPNKSYFDAARKVAMAAIVDIGGVPIEFVSVHLQSGMLRWNYRAQLTRLLQCVRDPFCKGSPPSAASPGARALVLGGDFNTWEGGLETSLLNAIERLPLKRVDGIVDTFTKLAGGKGLRTLDYFFVSPELYVGPGRVGGSRDGSDHFPIFAEFRLPGR